MRAHQALGLLCYLFTIRRLCVVLTSCLMSNEGRGSNTNRSDKAGVGEMQKGRRFWIGKEGRRKTFSITCIKKYIVYSTFFSPQTYWKHVIFSIKWCYFNPVFRNVYKKPCGIYECSKNLQNRLNCNGFYFLLSGDSKAVYGRNTIMSCPTCGHFSRYSTTKEGPKPQPMGLFWIPASTLLIPSQWFCIVRTNLNLRNTILFFGSDFTQKTDAALNKMFIFYIGYSAVLFPFLSPALTAFEGTLHLCQMLCLDNHVSVSGCAGASAQLLLQP